MLEFCILVKYKNKYNYINKKIYIYKNQYIYTHTHIYIYIYQINSLLKFRLIFNLFNNMFPNNIRISFCFLHKSRFILIQRIINIFLFFNRFMINGFISNILN